MIECIQLLVPKIVVAASVHDKSHARQNGILVKRWFTKQQAIYANAVNVQETKLTNHSRRPIN